jgi:uncharacterized peroxidase-related enzyme
MTRIAHLDPQTATGRARELLDGVQAKLGVVPNLFRVLGNAPAALQAYLGFGAALGEGGLTAQVREQVALTVAEINHCGYCLSAHTFIGRKLGLSGQEIADARRAVAADARTASILGLARAIVVRRGELGAADLEAARAAGLGDGDIVEVVANVALNIFSNYVNHIADTIIDFPRVEPGNGHAEGPVAAERERWV